MKSHTTSLKYSVSLAFSVVAAAALVACGGGGDASSAAATPTAAPAAVQTGQLVDAPVYGVNYHTATQSGTTDRDGRFRYLAGEKVTFSLGNLELGQATAASTVHIDAVVPVKDGAKQASVDASTNMGQLLQTLDGDDSTQRIDVSALNKRTNLPALSFSKQPLAFTADLKTWLQQSGMGSRKVVSSAQARQHINRHAAQPVFRRLELNVAHINDHHSHLESVSLDLTLAGKKTRVKAGGFPRVTQWFKDLETNGTKNLLKLHAGDAITGTPYFSFYKGKADADMMNTVCFDAFAIGNHEFDESDALLRDFLGHLWTASCQTPALTANVSPALGTPLMPSSAISYLQPYTVKEIDGVKVGIVGLTISGKTKNSSQPLPTTAFADETAAAQKAIDELKGKGIEHIVLLTHQGYAQDQAVAAQLTGVDVVVGGDSHTLTGDFSAVGFDTGGKTYPTVVSNKAGEKVCVVQAWEYTKAVGLLNVKFDSKGAVESCDGQPAILLGDSFKRKNAAGDRVAVDAATRAAILADIDKNPSVQVYAENTAAAAVLKNYKDRNEGLLNTKIGKASESLCLTRVPGSGDNRSAGTAGCARADRIARGSDVAEVVAASFLKAARRADIALQNAGGVRTPVAAGDITNRTGYKLLPFSNTLVELEMTGQQIIDTLEEAVSNHMDADANGKTGSSGSHPYAAGLRWNLDMSKARGARFSKVEVKDKTSGKWSAIDTAKTYVLVTNNYISGGKDGYATLGKITRAGKVVDTYLLYTQSFIDYVNAEGSISRPARSDYSHQSVTDSSGKLLPEQ